MFQRIVVSSGQNLLELQEERLEAIPGEGGYICRRRYVVVCVVGKSPGASADVVGTGDTPAEAMADCVSEAFKVLSRMVKP